MLVCKVMLVVRWMFIVDSSTFANSSTPWTCLFYGLDKLVDLIILSTLWTWPPCILYDFKLVYLWTIFFILLGKIHLSSGLNNEVVHFMDSSTSWTCPLYVYSSRDEVIHGLNNRVVHFMDPSTFWTWYLSILRTLIMFHPLGMRLPILWFWVIKSSTLWA